MRDSLFIAGRWQAPLHGGTMDVIDPCTAEAFAQVGSATSDDVELAVSSAKHAFRTLWRNASGAERGRRLSAMAQAISNAAERLARIESLNTGKPLAEARLDVAEAANCFAYYAELARACDGQGGAESATAGAGFCWYLRREPLGVAALIVPWNYPLLLASWKVAPALAAGCTIVLKPSELTPMTAIELARIGQEADLPPGVFNLLTGDGPSCGSPLVQHPDIGKVSFTGSGRTGAAILRAVADEIRPVTLELGGKSPMIVFEDADLDETVQWAMVGAFSNAGQICSATSRLLVHRSIFEQLTERLVEEAARLRLGPALDPATTMGPVISASQRERIEGFVAAGRADGRFLLGSGRPQPETSGFFYEPTIVSQVRTDSPLWQDEIFGPVLCINSFDTEAEAIAEANNTRFGLAASIMSADRKRSERVAAELAAGIVWLNCSQPTPIAAPWGGRKQSGLGRELGPWGLESFLALKQVTSLSP